MTPSAGGLGQAVGATMGDASRHDALVVGNGTAQSVTTTQTSVINPTLIPLDGAALSPTIQLFNPALGTLTSVTVTSAATMTANITATNAGNNATSATAVLNGSLSLTGLTADSDLTSNFGPTTSITAPLSPGQSTTFGPPGTPSISRPESNSVTLTSPADLAFFTAGGGRTEVSPALTANGSVVVTADPNGNLDVSTLTSASGNVSVSYTYTPTVQPPGGTTDTHTVVPPGSVSDNGPPASTPSTVTNVVAGGSNPGGAAPLPQVVRVERLGVHHQATRIVLTFSAGLNPAEARDVANYSLSGPVSILGRRGGNPVRAIPIRSALYDPSANTVMLMPAYRLNAHYHYRVTADLGALATGVSGATSITVFGGKYSLPYVQGHRGNFFVWGPRGNLLPEGWTPPPRGAIPALVLDRTDRLPPSARDAGQSRV